MYKYSLHLIGRARAVSAIEEDYIQIIYLVPFLKSDERLRGPFTLITVPAAEQLITREE